MNAWQVENGQSTPKLVLADIPPPQAGPGEVVVRVQAAGITPTELSWYPTTHCKDGTPRPRAVPGHEFSGVIASVGEGERLEVGAEVFGMNDWFAEGASAEFCSAGAAAIVRKPAGLSHAEAASVPISALTAWQGLFDRAQLQAGERVLIHGGGGAVGTLAIQLARWRGAHVLTTASALRREFLQQLGAEQVIDYRTERFEDFAQGVDVVFDGVGGATLARSWQVLNERGRLVTIAAAGEAAQDDRTKAAFFIVEPNSQELAEIAMLLDGGQLRPVVDALVPFASAASAYLNPTKIERRGCGKMVLMVESLADFAP